MSERTGDWETCKPDSCDWTSWAQGPTVYVNCSPPPSPPIATPSPAPPQAFTGPSPMATPPPTLSPITAQALTQVNPPRDAIALPDPPVYRPDRSRMDQVWG